MAFVMAFDILQNTRLNNIIGLGLCGIGFQIVGPTTLISVQP